MIDKDTLSREAEELRRSAELISSLDEVVERRSNAGKRQSLVDAIKKVQANFLNTSEAKVAYQGGTIHDVLVKSVNGRLLPDNESMFIYKDRYKGTPNWDTEIERHPLSSECFTRIEFLKKQIFDGKLDHLLGNDAKILIHGVMGYNGELLGVLGIDPMQGETYRRITEQNKETRDTGNYELRPEEVQLYQFEGEVLGTMIKKFIEGNNPRQALPIPPTQNIVDDDVTTVIKKVELKAKRSSKPDTSEVAMDTPIVGIVGFTLTDRIASDMGLKKETRGVLVIEVLENSIAWRAGLRAGTTQAVFGDVKGMLGGDIIVGVEDKAINKMEELVDYLNHYHMPGTRIRFRVIRNGEPVGVALVY